MTGAVLRLIASGVFRSTKRNVKLIKHETSSRQKHEGAGKVGEQLVVVPIRNVCSKKPE